MIGAWAENTPNEATLRALLKPWGHKLGVVLGGHQLGWDAGQAWIIADDPSLIPAGHEREFFRNPNPTDAHVLAILDRDEPNVAGLSGLRLTPAEVAAEVKAKRGAYPSIPVSPGGLAFVGGWWRVALSLRHFDLPYFRELQGHLGAGPYAINAGDTRPRLVEMALARNAGPWIVCGIPTRPAWHPKNTILAWVMQALAGVSMRQWVRFSKRGDVLAVVFWVLLQDGKQTAFGIYKPIEEGYVLTIIGKALWRVLMGNRRYPEVNRTYAR